MILSAELRLLSGSVALPSLSAAVALPEQTSVASRFIRKPTIESSQTGQTVKFAGPTGLSGVPTLSGHHRRGRS
jgi:hypothetical protein